MMCINVDRPYCSVRCDYYTRPTERAVQRLITANHKSLKALRVISGYIRVQRALRISRAEHIIRAAVIAADRIQKMHAGAVIACGTAPTRIWQSAAQRIERIAAIERWIN